MGGLCEEWDHVFKGALTPPIQELGLVRTNGRRVLVNNDHRSATGHRNEAGIKLYTQLRGYTAAGQCCKSGCWTRRRLSLLALLVAARVVGPVVGSFVGMPRDMLRQATAIAGEESAPRESYHHVLSGCGSLCSVWLLACRTGSLEGRDWSRISREQRSNDTMRRSRKS